MVGSVRPTRGPPDMPPRHTNAATESRRLSVPLSRDGRARVQAAVDLSGKSTTSWAIGVLDSAANHAMVALHQEQIAEIGANCPDLVSHKHGELVDTFEVIKLAADQRRGPLLSWGRHALASNLAPELKALTTTCLPTRGTPKRSMPPADTWLSIKLPIDLHVRITVIASRLREHRGGWASSVLAAAGELARFADLWRSAVKANCEQGLYSYLVSTWIDLMIACGTARPTSENKTHLAALATKLERFARTEVARERREFQIALS